MDDLLILLTACLAYKTLINCRQREQELMRDRAKTPNGDEREVRDSAYYNGKSYNLSFSIENAKLNSRGFSSY